MIENTHAAESFDTLFARLATSEFRRRFRLKAEDIAYIERKGMETIRRHAADFVRMRLAPAVIPNDGRQTPMRGHPVFIAQHATACCCRTCLMKWHGITPGHALTDAEKAFVIELIIAWIRADLAKPAKPERSKKTKKDVSPQPELF